MKQELMGVCRGIECVPTRQYIGAPTEYAYASVVETSSGKLTFRTKEPLKLQQQYKITLEEASE
jgi:hypothetical protein